MMNQTRLQITWGWMGGELRDQAAGRARLAQCLVCPTADLQETNHPISRVPPHPLLPSPLIQVRGNIGKLRLCPRFPVSKIA